MDVVIRCPDFWSYSVCRGGTMHLNAVIKTFHVPKFHVLSYKRFMIWSLVGSVLFFVLDGCTRIQG